MVEGSNLGRGGKVVDFDAVIVAAGDGNGAEDGDGFDGGEVGGEGEEWGQGYGIGFFPGFQFVAPNESLVRPCNQTHL